MLHQLHRFKILSEMRRWLRVNSLHAELNPICHLLVLCGAHHILHVSRVGVNRLCAHFTRFLQATIPLLFRKRAARTYQRLSHSVPSTELWKNHHSRFPNASHLQTHLMTVRSIDRIFGTRSSSWSVCLSPLGVWHLTGLQEHLSYGTARKDRGKDRNDKKTRKKM